MDYIAMLEGVQMPGTGPRSLGRAYGRPFGSNSYRPFGRSFGDGPSCADPCIPRPNANCTPMPNANCTPRGNADCTPRGNANCAPRPNANCAPCSPPQMVFVPTQPFLPPPVLIPTQPPAQQGGGQPQGQQPGGPFVTVTPTEMAPITPGGPFVQNTYTLVPTMPFNPALVATPQGMGPCPNERDVRNPDGSCTPLQGIKIQGRLGRLGRIFSGR